MPHWAVPASTFPPAQCGLRLPVRRLALRVRLPADAVDGVGFQDQYTVARLLDRLRGLLECHRVFSACRLGLSAALRYDKDPAVFRMDEQGRWVGVSTTYASAPRRCWVVAAHAPRSTPARVPEQPAGTSVDRRWTAHVPLPEVPRIFRQRSGPAVRESRARRPADRRLDGDVVPSGVPDYDRAAAPSEARSGGCLALIRSPTRRGFPGWGQWR